MNNLMYKLLLLSLLFFSFSAVVAEEKWTIYPNNNAIYAVMKGPEFYDFCNKVLANLYLLYFNTVDYNLAQIGQTFTIREGGNIVGFGEILERVDKISI